MPQAVAAFSATNLSSAQTSKPVSPAITDGSSGSFQSALDQARPSKKTSDDTASKPAATERGKTEKASAKGGAPSSTNSTGDSGDTKTSDDTGTAASQATAVPTQQAPAATDVPQPARPTKKNDKTATADKDASLDVNPVVAATASSPASPSSAANPSPAQDQTDADTGAGKRKSAGSATAGAQSGTSVKPVDPAQQDDSGDANVTSESTPAASSQTDQASAQPAAASATKPQVKKADKAKASLNSDSPDPSTTPQGIAPQAANNAKAQSAASNPQSTSDGSDDPSIQATAAPVTDKPAESTHSTSGAATDHQFAEALSNVQPHNAGDHVKQAAPAPAPQAPPPITPDQFAETNHANIVQGIHGQLLPSGGSMQIRLDPPELGALSVTVRVHEGVMTAAFQTSNDQATRALSHSLTQLKSALESQGMSVGKLHVEQTAKGNSNQSSGDGNSSSHQDSASDHPAQQEQQRREMLRRMWRRLSGSNDPLDMVA
ncbi:MAG TPA: flagellar hook-length control protein FliK [Tepidisphaeraceae bacterium]|nr:flagellar hook-length control protein FliK [Tepidisphaeraceae bacterium]